MRLFLASVVFMMSVLLWGGPAGAQTPVAPPPVPPTPTWSGNFPGDPQNWPSPEAACQAQHDYYNSNATLQSPTYRGGQTAGCHWVLNENSNTILPALATSACLSGLSMASSGACLRPNPVMDSRAECNCGNGTSPPTGTAQPQRGDPIALNHGALVEHEVDYASADGRFNVERNYYSLGSDYMNVVSTTYTPGFGARWHGLVPGRLAVSGQFAQRIEYLDVQGGFSKFDSADPNNTATWNYYSQGANRRRFSMIGTPSTTRPDFFFAQAAVPNGPGEVRMDMAQGEYILFRRAGSSAPSDGIRYLVPVEHGYADGYRIFYTYPDTGEFPSSVSDSWGRQMALTWADADRLTVASFSDFHPIKVISEVLLPDGTTLQYGYDYAVDDIGSKIKDRLNSVKHMSSDGSVLWAHTYLYENGAVHYGLTGKVDQNGNRLSTYSYDASGLATSAELAGGVDKYTIVNLEDANYAMFWRYVTNSLGHREDYRFDKYHNVADSQHVLATVDGYAGPGVEATHTSYEYYGYIGDLTVANYRDEKGRLLHFDNDAQLRPASMLEAGGTAEARTTALNWHPVFDLPTHVERPGLNTDYTYSSTGVLLTKTETDTTTQTVPYSTAGQTRQWTYVWNGNGRLSSIDGPKGLDANGNNDITTFAYDTGGNLLTTTNALGHVTTFSDYDPNGRPGKMTDPNGIDTLYTYDLLGRVKTITVRDPVTAAGDALTNLDYDIEGRVVGVTMPGTEEMFVDYDLAGRITTVRAANGEQIAYDYDAMNDVTAETVKRTNGTAARTITRTFDQLGRMVTETLGTNRTTSWAYDKTNNVTMVTSARSNATQQAFDGLDRLVSTLAPDTGTTATAYDQFDREKSFTDAKAITTNFIRDGFGDIIREISPDRGTSTYYYDAAGDRVAEIDGRGQLVNLVRDALGRVTKKTPAGLPTSEIVTYTYDVAGIAGSYGKGRLATVVDATGTTSFKYDHRGNMVTKQQSIGATATATLQYAYDLADRVIGMVYPSGRVVQYARDTKGRVVTVTTRPTATGADVTLASGITYEPFGSLISATLGNGLTMTQTWGNDGRLANKRLYRTGGGVNLSLLTYGYDNDDNITSIIDSADATRNVTYGYDSVGRVSRSVTAVGSIRRQDFIYDLNGNRTGVENRTTPDDAAPVSTDIYTLAAGKNQLLSVVDSNGTRSLTYDDRGNTSSDTRSGPLPVAIVVGYDGYGRLVTYQRPGVVTLAHSYNGLDDRVSTATITGTTTSTRQFVYDHDGRLLGEYGTAATDVKAETIWLSPEVASDGQPFGGDDGVGGYAPLAVFTGGVLYWVHGSHLGVPMVMTDGGGNVAAPTGFALAGFPGQIQTLHGLYYNRYRDYDSLTGRYIQADPIGLKGGRNVYVYAANNPIRWVDPKGLYTAWWGYAGGAAAEIIGLGPEDPLADALAAAIWVAAQKPDCPNRDGDSCVAGWMDEVDNYCAKTFRGGGYRRCVNRANERLRACKRDGGHWPPNGPDRWSYQDEYGFRP